MAAESWSLHGIVMHRDVPCVRRLLVGHDGDSQSTCAVRDAAYLAEQSHGCVTIVLALPRATWPAALAAISAVSVCTREVVESARAAALDELRQATREIPEDVSVITRVTERQLALALVMEWRRGAHDTAVMAPARMCWSQRRAAIRALSREGAEVILGGGTLRYPPLDRIERPVSLAAVQ